MRRVRPLALTISLAVACATTVGCSPDRQSGMNKKAEAATTEADTDTSLSPPNAASSESQPAQASAGVSGFEMPDSKSMLITDEAMTSSLSTPVADPIAPHGQSMQQTPIIPTMAK